MNSIVEAADKTTFDVWFLIGAALVFFMQAGFAMVETGFTRAKNAGNIIMKNLLDFCIGTVVFAVLGFSLMMGENYLFGVIGVPGFQIFADFNTFISTNASSFVFNLVFCATAATIVSGAMAERTKFLSYCIYSAVISLVVYPIEAGWIWNSEGWLNQLGFIDYAGSTAIHMVGGIAALIGAVILGPRLGKYNRNEKGKITGVNAIPGHSLTLGALGCFILWFGWYGFNGAAATSVSELGSIFLTTTISPAVATVVCMIFTWLKNGKPDVSMCLNASLAGLVGITAGCASLDALGAAAVGLVSGIIVVLIVELLDLKLHIDDPVGAVAVHCGNGIWATLAVGLFANADAPTGVNGLFWGIVRGDAIGGLRFLGVQCIGILAVAAWTTICMTATFLTIKKTVGLRVSADEEIMGLDSCEHGLPSAYADFVPAAESLPGYPESEEAPAVVAATIAVDPTPDASLPTVTVVDTRKEKNDIPKLSKAEIVCRESKLEPLKNAMLKIGITGMTVTHVLGFGVQNGQPEYYRGVRVDTNLLPKVQVDIVVSKVPVRTVIDSAKSVLCTGHIGDGKIFVYDVENAVKVRTGEEGFSALQDVE